MSSIMAKSESKTDQQISRIKNHRLIAPVIVVGVIIIGIVTFGESIQTMVGWVSSFWTNELISTDDSVPDLANRSVQKELIHPPTAEPAVPLVPDAKQELAFEDLERNVPAPPRDQSTIRERSAVEVLRNLQSTNSYDIEEKVEDLYLGLWTRWPGWRTTVRFLPSQIFGERWYCCFEEAGSGTLIMADTAQDLASLRVGDLVIVNGRIRDVSADESIKLEDAIIVSKPNF